MIYGQPPFHHLSVFQKMKAIPDGSHVIDFPEYSIPQIPASRSSGDSKTPPRRLDHLKRRVRRDVIASMKSCLCRNPKERSTIPELSDQDWLAMKERMLFSFPRRRGTKLWMTAGPPTVKQLLAHDETIINPYYMRQLLEYGIKLGKEGKGAELSSDALLREAGVRSVLWICELHVDDLFLAFGCGTEIYCLFGRLLTKFAPRIMVIHTSCFNSSTPSVSYAFLHASPRSQAS